MSKRKNLTKKELSYTVIYEPAKEGGYQVIVPRLEGLVTYGRTFDEARKMARDAIHCYIGALVKDKKRVPDEAGFLQERISVSI